MADLNAESVASRRYSSISERRFFSITSLKIFSKARPDLPPEFAEISGLTEKRAAHRADMQALVDAAEYLSTKYRELYGERVEQLLNYMEETGDAETFKQKITEMMKEPPAEQAVETVRNASFFARLMGLGSVGRSM